MSGMTEAQWLSVARSVRSRPPMPWFALRDMADDDLRAIYHFVRSLGSSGTPAPAYVPPGQTPKPPYVQFPAPWDVAPRRRSRSTITRRTVPAIAPSVLVRTDEVIQ